jgi:hypothetical protein
MLVSRRFAIFMDHELLTYALSQVSNPCQCRQLSYVVEFTSDIRRHIYGPPEGPHWFHPRVSMSGRAEKSFKWELDTDPDLSRELRTLPVNSARSNRANGLIVGGSSRWSISKASVDAMIPVLQARLAVLDAKAPVILWCLDSVAFKALTPEGDLIAVSRSQKDGKFHGHSAWTAAPLSPGVGHTHSCLY